MNALISEYKECGNRRGKEMVGNHMRGMGGATVSDFSNPMNDDSLIMKTIREITSRGNNAEVRQRSNGKLAVYEVKKSISIG